MVDKGNTSMDQPPVAVTSNRYVCSPSKKSIGRMPSYGSVVFTNRSITSLLDPIFFTAKWRDEAFPTICTSTGPDPFSISTMESPVPDNTMGVGGIVGVSVGAGVWVGTGVEVGFGVFDGRGVLEGSGVSEGNIVLVGRAFSVCETCCISAMAVDVALPEGVLLRIEPKTKLAMQHKKTIPVMAIMILVFLDLNIPFEAF